jgi:hypothetical protein
MKTDIEYAALLVADSMPRTELHKCGGLWMPSYGHYWKPLGDDGDSRRLERACFRWTFSAYGDGPIPEPLFSLIEAVVDARYKGSDAEDNAAVYLWAVAIGKTMEGNDNAG